MNKLNTQAHTIHLPKNIRQVLSQADFRGLIAPVFTCFGNDEHTSLNIIHIDKYAAYLKSEKIIGVVVNSIIGEGPTMSVRERKRNAEVWFEAAYKYNLILIVQIGGAPLCDVLELARHAEQLGVHGVLCLPDPLYKPSSVEQLIGYCKLVTSQCRSKAFFYYHVPLLTGVDINMPVFCEQAQAAIPTFMGIHYVNPDLAQGAKCFGGGRVTSLGYDNLLASGLLLGFETAIASVTSIKPNLCWEIYAAMRSNDLPLAKAKQSALNELISQKLVTSDLASWVASLKMWFNEEVLRVRKLDFSAGPTRKLF